MSLPALPTHLQENNSYPKPGTDWDNWIQRFIPQKWFAFGPNATGWIDWVTLICLPYKFQCREVDVHLFGSTWTLARPEPLAWFRIVFPIPVLARWRRYSLLIIGKGMTRWESKNAKSQIFVAPYAEGWQSSFFGRRKQLPATEMNPGHVEFRNPLLLENLNGYTPSIIQYWSGHSFAITWPLHVQLTIQWGGRDPNTGRPRKTFFFRAGFRNDIGDDYHSGPDFFLGGSFN